MISDSRIRLRAWGGRQLRRGPRSVLQTPATARVGNLLYFWLQAHVQQAAGRDLKVLHNGHVEAWRPLWPGAVEQFDVQIARRVDRRLELPERHFQEFGVDFTAEQLRDFVTSYLMTSEFKERMVPPDRSMLVLNVRRGDYYSNPEYRARYAMDIEQYLRQAVDVVCSSATITRVAIVSDDPEWCSINLQWLRELGETSLVTGSPAVHLAVLASASHLVLANSTFSYWGAYLAGARDGNSVIVAPQFHAAHVNGGRAWQLDPAWHVIDGSS